MQPFFGMKEERSSSSSLTSNDMEKLLELQNSHLRRMQNYPYSDFAYRPLFAENLESNQMLQNLLKHYQNSFMEDSWFLGKREETERQEESSRRRKKDDEGKLFTKQRKTNFTAKEVETLLNCVAEKKEIILFGVAGGKGWARAWQEIGHEVSKVEGIERSEGDVRKKWTYLKWEAKNTSKPGRDPVSKQVLNILTSRDREVADAMNLRKEKSPVKEDVAGTSPLALPSHPPVTQATPAPPLPLLKPATTPPPPQAQPIPTTAPKRHSLPPLAPKPMPTTAKEAKPLIKQVKPPPPPPPPAEVCLRWNSYHANMQNTFPSLLNNEQFVDVTLACDGRSIKCHKVMLSACSPYLEELLSSNPCQHPIIFLKDMKFWQLAALVDFMYRGEVNVTQDKLPQLLSAAEALQIKGLASPVHPTGTSKHAQDVDPDAVNYLKHMTTDIKTEPDNEYQQEMIIAPPKTKKRKISQPAKSEHHVAKGNNGGSEGKVKEHHKNEEVNISDIDSGENRDIEEENSGGTTDYDTSYKDFHDLGQNNGNQDEDLDIDEEQAQIILERYSQNDENYSRDQEDESTDGGSG